MDYPVFPTNEIAQHGALWPSAEYELQLLELKKHIGKTLYLVVMNLSDIHLTVRLEEKPLELLDVVEFPRPDPQQHLFPHLLVLSDGRGINLGRILRASSDRPFEPEADKIVYQQKGLVKHLLFQTRRLSVETIADTSRQQLARLLGQQYSKQIE